MVRIEKKGRVWTVSIRAPRRATRWIRKARTRWLRLSRNFDRGRMRSGRGAVGRGRRVLRRLGSQILPLRCPRDPSKSTRSTTRSTTASPIPRGPLGPTRLELDKPVIAAVAGPAVAGGFELALWCDVRVMEQSAYFGVYCRRWGVPLIDGGTVRLPRIVGMGRAMEIILTGRKVPADEALRIGACEQSSSRAVARVRRSDGARDCALSAAAVRPTGAPGRRLRPAGPRGVAPGVDQRSGRSSRKAPAALRLFAAGKGRHGDFAKSTPSFSPGAAHGQGAL